MQLSVFRMALVLGLLSCMGPFAIDMYLPALPRLSQDLGADIAKIAVMPKDYADVLTLLGATLKARTGAVKVPIVTMSMGPEGEVTRVAGGLFGSDLTFAVGKEASAPGQIPITDLRQAMSVLYV